MPDIDKIREERKEHCNQCLLTHNCTRKTIYLCDGYCWAERDDLDKKAILDGILD